MITLSQQFSLSLNLYHIGDFLSVNLYSHFADGRSVAATFGFTLLCRRISLSGVQVTSTAQGK